MTLKLPLMTLRPKTTAPLCPPCKNLQKLSNFRSSNSYNSPVIDEKPVENITSYFEMTFNDLKVTLRSKTAASLLSSRKNPQKLLNYRCTKSYNSLDIRKNTVISVITNLISL